MRRSSREVLECSIEPFLNSDLAVPYSRHLYVYIVRVTIVIGLYLFLGGCQGSKLLCNKVIGALDNIGRNPTTEIIACCLSASLVLLLCFESNSVQLSTTITPYYYYFLLLLLSTTITLITILAY
jgi:uncharacterized membrane protein